MSTIASPYRPHNPGHDYYAPGIYLITLVIRGGAPLLATLNDSVQSPAAVPTPLGQAVLDCWAGIPAIQRQKGRQVVVYNSVCMPDHFHGVIEVRAPLDRSLGEVIRGFKAGCTMAWHRLMSQPSMAAIPAVAEPYLAQREALKRMSRAQRAAYYAAHPEAQQPLFDDNYDDTICLTDPATGTYCPRHLDAMLRYVDDNPRRAIICRLRPDFMRRCLHIRIAGREYAAFGNLFLLRWPRRVQVFCHRKAPDGITPYEQSEAFRIQCAEWKRQVLEGATVLVTPGISAGEKLIKDRCLMQGYPLIHLQKEPIGPRWKPEKSRFDLCAIGRLLILAPWKPEALGSVRGVPSDTDYSIFHNLNTLAEEVCLFDGEAKILSY